MKRVLPVLLFTALAFSSAAQETLLKPFILAEKGAGEAGAKVGEVKQKLTGAGFEVIGEYSPYPAATVVVVTSDALKQNAAQTDYGGFGAALRVTVTSAGDAVQVAYTNPVYMAHVYRMKSDLADVATAMRSALGDQGEYGPEEGLTAEKLSEYHYKWLMPYFYDRLNLVEYAVYQNAIKAVEAALAAQKGGVSKVYRVDIPGKEQTLYGVQIHGSDSITKCGGDQYIMERIDFKDVKSTPHLPYEMLVVGGTVYALPAEFRIAISFPDLSMVGSNSFASIMCAPSAVEAALTEGAGGKLEE
ncbi:MAG: hypothetical protein JSW10_06495 [Pseudomonadota bacterium]|nr:MAG: hypothetical protein JSW10_06495 [Pseudomonadota bacterium]